MFMQKQYLSLQSARKTLQRDSRTARSRRTARNTGASRFQRTSRSARRARTCRSARTRRGNGSAGTARRNGCDGRSRSARTCRRNGSAGTARRFTALFDTHPFRLAVPADQGPAGVSYTVHAENTATESVATNTIIPISQTAQSTGGTFTVSNNAVNVPIGEYLVTFGGAASTTGATQKTITLYVNGAASNNVVYDGSDTGITSAAKTVYLNFSSPGTLSIYNTTADTASFNNAFITVTQLSTTA